MHPLSVDRRSSIPLYCQIRQKLLAEIESGRAPAGSLLPSEQEIARQTGVSRMTARQTLKSLCRMGVTVSRRGKGTFVARAKLDKNFRQVRSFTEEMKALGLKPRSRILSLKLVLPPVEARQALHIEPSVKVFNLRRLRLANGVPMSIESSFLPERLYPDFERAFHRGMSLYEMLENRYGVRMEIADEVVEADLARAEDAELLRVAPGSPVFQFTRISYLLDGRAAEYVESVYRGDRYRIVNRLSRVEH